MSRLQTRTLTRILIEIGVVTGGILIAFALDAWWDNRAQARQEQAHLRALASDFRENIERLNALIEREEAVVSNSQSLLRLAQSPGPHSTQAIHRLLGQVFSSQRFDPVLGANSCSRPRAFWRRFRRNWTIDEQRHLEVLRQKSVRRRRSQRGSVLAW
jgi:hypothetical protein